MKSRIQLLVGLLAGVSLLPAAFAQSERSGNDTARVMQQLQQVTSERTVLKADNDKLKQEVDSLKAQLAKLQGEQGALQRQAQAALATTTRLNSASSANAEALERSRAQMQELVGRFRETAETLRDVEGDRNTARSELAARDQELKACVDKNVGLYELNSEVLARMEDRGFWSGMASKEPFTGIARTRLENLIDDYRYRVEEFRAERQKASSQ